MLNLDIFQRKDPLGLLVDTFVATFARASAGLSGERAIFPVVLKRTVSFRPIAVHLGVGTRICEGNRPRNAGKLVESKRTTRANAQIRAFRMVVFVVKVVSAIVFPLEIALQ